MRAVRAAVAAALLSVDPAHAQVNETALTEIAKKAQFTGSISIGTEFAKDVTSRVTINFPRLKVAKEDKGYNATHWRWASITKQVVAVLVLQEVGKGAIDLDQPVSRYLPKFASPNADKLTVRQLLRHQSGLPNPDDAEGFYTAYYTGSRDPVTGYCASQPKGQPGGNWSYNNCDYMVAGALLEAVTGKSWQVLVQERIAKPLGLRSLQAYPGPKKSVTRSGLVGGKVEPQIDLAAYGASAGLYGSAGDLLAFDEALMTGKLLAQKELDQLWDGRPELGFIALGQWVFDASLNGCAKPVKLVERRGSIGGVQVRNFIAPDQKVAIAIFTDKSEADFAFGEIWQGSGFSHDVLNAVVCGSSKEAS